eukprot:TRINITY_DN7896_c0_g2_i1.p1 TRINITY_DN7896_c0_g2~~TRINITY_DN7896_c0_g2_i1.p1  ORF type:complete len:366 (+),score=34.03 TRINITY_DN7896_c0_g2_i1:35-1099(+)
MPMQRVGSLPAPNGFAGAAISLSRLAGMIALLSVANAQGVDEGCIAKSSVDTLTFAAGDISVRKWTEPGPTLRCLGGCIPSVTVSRIKCVKNETAAGRQRWTCPDRVISPSKYTIAKNFSIRCEGCTGPKDTTLIRRGSCVLKYRLRKRATRGPTWNHRGFVGKKETNGYHSSVMYDTTPNTQERLQANSTLNYVIIILCVWGFFFLMKRAKARGQHMHTQDERQWQPPATQPQWEEGGGVPSAPPYPGSDPPRSHAAPGVGCNTRSSSGNGLGAWGWGLSGLVGGMMLSNFLSSSHGPSTTRTHSEYAGADSGWQDQGWHNGDNGSPYQDEVSLTGDGDAGYYDDSFGDMDIE